MFAPAALVASLALATTVSAFSILTPNANTWWVANSENVFSWTCNDNPPALTFTVLIGNQDTKILTQPQAVIAIQQNSDCSKAITQQQANFTAGTGYFLQLANTLNQTDVFAQSEPFEVKPLGSAYPTTTSLAASNTASGASGTNTAAAANNTGGSGNNGASSLKISAGLVGAAAALFAFMA